MYFPLQHIYHSLGKQRGASGSDVSAEQSEAPRHLGDVNLQTCLRGRTWLRVRSRANQPISLVCSRQMSTQVKLPKWKCCFNLHVMAQFCFVLSFFFLNPSLNWWSDFGVNLRNIRQKTEKVLSTLRLPAVILFEE